MSNITYATEVLASVVHTLTSLSIIVAHLIHNDPLGAVSVTLVGLLCLVALTLGACGCEIVRWKVRQYIRNCEMANTRPDIRKLKG
jgi:hypothetical protein